MTDSASTRKPKDEVTTRELVWLIEAAQEREQITVETCARRGLYSDLGDARGAVARCIRLGLLSGREDGETKGHDILINNVVRLLIERGEHVPPTAGLTRGEWQLASRSDRNPDAERIILARQESTGGAVVVAHIPLPQMPRGTPDREEREVTMPFAAKMSRERGAHAIFASTEERCWRWYTGAGTHLTPRTMRKSGYRGTRVLCASIPVRYGVSTVSLA